MKKKILKSTISKYINGKCAVNHTDLELEKGVDSLLSLFELLKKADQKSINENRIKVSSRPNSY